MPLFLAPRKKGIASQPEMVKLTYSKAKWNNQQLI